MAATHSCYPFQMGEKPDDDFFEVESFVTGPPEALSLVADLNSLSPDRLGKVIYALEKMFGAELQVVSAKTEPPGGGGKASRSSRPTSLGSRR